jgi:hypothetical protein
MLWTRFASWQVWSTQISFSTRSRLLTSPLKLSASWWSTLMMATSHKKSQSMSKMEPISQRVKWFQLPRRWSLGLKLSTIQKFVTETWSAQTFFWRVKERLSSVILTWVKSCTEECCILRRAPHTTRALRFGKTNPMIKRVTSGPLDASYTRCSWKDLHLSPIVWKTSTKKSY